MSELPSITGLRFDELARSLGDPERPSPTRARVFLRWLWRPGAVLSALPAVIDGIARQKLELFRRQVVVPDVREVDRQESSDGTVKLLLSARGTPIETVIIPGRGRTTLCISSQSGCSRQCRFCATAHMGFRRNLDAAEIVAQVHIARRYAPPGLPVRNVVFMGMGEPLDNLDAVVQAIDVLCIPSGCGLSPGHVTVSTSGVLPAMRRFIEMSDAGLALSLNGTTENQRRDIMPIDKRWSLSELMAFVSQHSARRIFFIEYVMLGDFNDTLADAQRLGDLLIGLNVRVNLIPYNPHPDAPFLRPSDEAVQSFFAALNGRGVRTLIRVSRGRDIAAACGLLQRRTETAFPL